MTIVCQVRLLDILSDTQLASSHFQCISQAEARCRRKKTDLEVVFERERITNGSIANLYCPDGFGVLDCLTISSVSLRLYCTL